MLAPPGPLQREPCTIEVDDPAVTFVAANLLDRGQKVTEAGGFQMAQSADGWVLIGFAHRAGLIRSGGRHQ